MINIMTDEYFEVLYSSEYVGYILPDNVLEKYFIQKDITCKNCTNKFCKECYEDIKYGRDILSRTDNVLITLCIEYRCKLRIIGKFNNIYKNYIVITEHDYWGDETVTINLAEFIVDEINNIDEENIKESFQKLKKVVNSSLYYNEIEQDIEIQMRYR